MHPRQSGQSSQSRNCKSGGSSRRIGTEVRDRTADADAGDSHPVCSLTHGSGNDEYYDSSLPVIVELLYPEVNLRCDVKPKIWLQQLLPFGKNRIGLEGCPFDFQSVVIDTKEEIAELLMCKARTVGNGRNILAQMLCILVIALEFQLGDFPPVHFYIAIQQLAVFDVINHIAKLAKKLDRSKLNPNCSMCSTCPILPVERNKNNSLNLQDNEIIIVYESANHPICCFLAIVDAGGTFAEYCLFYRYGFREKYLACHI